MLLTHERRFWASITVLLAASGLALFLGAVLFDISYDYTLQTVMLGSAVLGLVSGILSTFAVLREQSLLGDTLSHAALPGVVIAFLITGRDLGWLLVGAAVTGWLGTLLVAAVLRTTRIKQDAALGIILATFFGFGVALLSYIQGREDASRAGLDRFIFGQAAAMTADEVRMVSLVALLIMAMIALFWKEFKLLSFDSEFAMTNGFRVPLLDVALSTLMVMVIVLGLQLAGVILMVGLLIAPAVAARQWTNSLGEMAILSGIFGALAGGGGAMISAAETGLPTGPLIIVTISMIVAVSLVFAPERGVLWRWWRHRQAQQRFAAETILLDMFRLGKRHEDLSYPVPEGMLVSVRGKVAKGGLRELASGGLIQFDGAGNWQLTAAGIMAAQRDFRNRKLWELYKLHQNEFGEVALVDDLRRNIHTSLSPELVNRLEHMLEAE